MNSVIKVLLASCAMSALPAFADASAEISGEYYDWQKTLQPEQPWLHDYSQTLVMKVFLCSRSGAGNVDRVYLKFDDALAVIKKLDNLTLGIPKIVYLVGWQFTGHDSGYPSWSVVNEALKRPQDENALQSLQWLMQEAAKYHTTVSLHINMIDAFESSPLWKLYSQNDVIIKDKAGKPIKGEVFDGTQSYQISYAQEWKLGFAQKRIDELLKKLPELKRAGTIHIDAFHSIQPTRPKDELSSPYLGYTIDDEIAAQRKIFRYWRKQGLDLTAEGGMYWLRKDPFIGLQPMAWHYSVENFQKENWLRKPADFDSLPATLYTGTPMQAEQEIKKDPAKLTGILKQFSTQVVPWYYRNNRQPKLDTFKVDGDDVFLPALWLPSTIVAYSDKGYTAKTWQLPASWGNVRDVKLQKISLEGLGQPTLLPVKDRSVELTVKAGEGFVIRK